MKNIKNLIIPVCILLASCNQTYYKYYGPYLKVGSDIELIKSRIILDEEMVGGPQEGLSSDPYECCKFCARL